MKCSICGKEIGKYGNGAYPVNNGKCCDECNIKIVVPARIKLAKIEIGDEIKIIKMLNEPNYDGTIGVVDHIDDAGQIHGSWGGCALICGVDEFIIINKE